MSASTALGIDTPIINLSFKDKEVEVEDEAGFLESERLKSAPRNSSSKPYTGVVIVALPVSLSGVSRLFSS